MTIEGYFDGTAVRTLEPVDLKPNQRVFISVLDNDYSDSKKQRIQKKLDCSPSFTIVIDIGKHLHELLFGSQSLIAFPILQKTFCCIYTAGVSSKPPFT